MQTNEQRDTQSDKKRDFLQSSIPHWHTIMQQRNRPLETRAEIAQRVMEIYHDFYFGV